MSDNGRQNISDKIASTVKPDSEKSNTEHAGDFLKGKGDKLGSAAQPESEKSYIQQATDAITGSK